MQTIRAKPDGQWKPNDLPDLEVNSVRKLTFNLGAAIGAATVSTFAISGNNVTFGSVTLASPSAVVTMTAGNTGTHIITTSAVLSNGETLKAALRLKVLDSTHETNGRDYA